MSFVIKWLATYAAVWLIWSIVAAIWMWASIWFYLYCEGTLKWKFKWSRPKEHGTVFKNPTDLF